MEPSRECSISPTSSRIELVSLNTRAWGLWRWHFVHRHVDDARSDSGEKVSKSCFWNFQRKLKSLNFVKLIFHRRHRNFVFSFARLTCCDHGDLLYLLNEIPLDVFAAGNFSLKHHFVKLVYPTNVQTSLIKSLNILFPMKCNFSQLNGLKLHEITTKNSVSERMYENLVAHGQTAILIICLH